ncbi:hypothetical protein GGTG_02143 [Gaeumannomyces tritici R3-111a-1]|uniref:SP-RING-type domain-containing protein n=1 Tax=Gaeumannomyces tritici (strain R3-111a-1) TaxID=644352 RepID=J3NLJ4_GAET3|nr:hypothetical protein GGTG_02143 [Gaeumannomyces tritici R3-111a-1]EJT82169.1 hypothetical protein GGTG_02143 [Gaeumannomyces tritici R3-111a-1]
MPRPTPPADVAAANQYLGVLGGRRRPSWITTTPAAASNLRTKRTFDQALPPDLPRSLPPSSDSLAQQQSIHPNVLPSPAPSDEPSPTATIPQDSANQNPLSDEAPPQSMLTPGSAPDALHSTPVTETRLPAPAGLAALDNQALNIGHGSPPGPATVLVSETSGFWIPPAAANAPDTSPVSVNVASPQTPQPFMLSNGASSNIPPSAMSPAPRTPGQSPQVQTGNLPKKRRVGSTANPFSEDLKMYLAAKIQSMPQGLARSRMILVSDAYQKSDLAFLHIHQTYCAWSQGELATLTEKRGIPWSTVDKAFEILKKILKDNLTLSADSLRYFTAVPGPLEAAITKPWLSFVESMANQWENTVYVAFSQKRPLLVSEMICFLGCRSIVMQKLLFTANRRSLGIIDDAGLGATIDAVFAQDQRWAMSTPDFQVGNSQGLTWQYLESRSQRLVGQYQACVMAANTAIAANTANTANTANIVNTANNSNQTFASQDSSTSWAPWSTSPAASLPQVLQSPNPFGTQRQQHQQQQQQQQQQQPTQPAAYPDGAHRQQNTRASVMGTGMESMTGTSYATQAPLMLPQTMSPGIHGGVHPNATQQQSSAQTSQNFPVGQQFSRAPGFAVQAPPPIFSPYTTQAPTPSRHPHHQQLIQEYRRQSLPLAQAASPTTTVPSNGHMLPPASNVVFPSQLQGASAHTVVTAMPNIVPSNGDTYGRVYQAYQARHAAPAPVGPPSAPINRETPLLPPVGELIPRHEHSHDQYHESSMNMTLHQVHLRSPVRTNRVLTGKRETPQRHYQFVNGFAVAPVVVASSSHGITELDFDVDIETISRLSKPVPQQGRDPQVPVHEYEDGTLRMRLRCCKIDSATADLSQSAWASLETSWPAHIFMVLNGRTGLTPKRKPHYGKDLPAELTSHIGCGKNQVKIALAMHQAPLEYFAVAVETIVTKSHSSLWNQTRNHQVTPREKTLEVIRKRTSSSSNNDNDDDGIMIVTEELPIDLADPFSAVLFETPVRGANCTHLECFDLKLWLETRERKPAYKCISHKADTCDATCRWQISEPTLVDKWRCPIKSCSGDARPCSLVVDGFLLEVRQKLESAGRLDVRSIRVSADGSWKPVPERREKVDDHDDSGSDDDLKGKHVLGRRSKSKSGPSRASSTSSVYPDVRALHGPPEIIDLT